ARAVGRTGPRTRSRFGWGSSRKGRAIGSRPWAGSWSQRILMLADVRAGTWYASSVIEAMSPGASWLASVSSLQPPADDSLPRGRGGGLGWGHLPPRSGVRVGASSPAVAGLGW